MEATVVVQRVISKRGERMFSEHEKSQHLVGADATKIAFFSGERHRFHCPECKYEFEAIIQKVSQNKTWCPCCNPNSKSLCDRPDCNNCKARSFESNVKAQLWLNKNDKTPRQTFRTSNKKVWFRCDKCPHELFISPANVSNDFWCKYCANQALCDDIDCEYCKDKSFESHPYCCEHWSNQNVISPRNVFLQSHSSEYWFLCKNCPHEYEATPAYIYRGNRCPYCANQKRCGQSNCKFCFDHSFASHPDAQDWSSENELPAIMVALTCHKKFKFDCLKCQHSYDQSPAEKVAHNTGCPICAGKILCENDGCSKCFEKSFASHPKASWLISANAREIFKYSNKTLQFQCPLCQDIFPANPAALGGCPKCKRVTQRILFERLKVEFHYLEFGWEKSFDWCRDPISGRKLPFDITMFLADVIFEVDGGQHFVQVMNWQSPEKTQEKDHLKMRFALQQGFRIIRIYQPDVLSDIEWAMREIFKALDSSAKIIYISKSTEQYEGWSLHEDLW